MPRFTVTLSDVMTDIEADSEQEAIAVAEERLDQFGANFRITTTEEEA